MSVKRCQQEVDSEEFSWWIAYNRIEPFGEKRADIRSAIVASVIANVNRDKKKKPSPFKTTDFMPEIEGKKYTEYIMTPEETAEAAQAVFGQLAAMTEQGLLGELQSE